jgi:hypothetical protein
MLFWSFNAGADAPEGIAQGAACAVKALRNTTSAKPAERAKLR